MNILILAILNEIKRDIVNGHVSNPISIYTVTIDKFLIIFSYLQLIRFSIRLNLHTFHSAVVFINYKYELEQANDIDGK